MDDAQRPFRVAQQAEQQMAALIDQLAQTVLRAREPGKGIQLDLTV